MGTAKVALVGAAAVIVSDFVSGLDAVKGLPGGDMTTKAVHYGAGIATALILFKLLKV